MDQLDRIVARDSASQRLWAILFLDLDRFKVINDSLGHISGDLVLVEAARRLERFVRSGDTLTRLGGDEFIILLDDIDDLAAACEVARRVLRAFEKPIWVAGREVFATGSLGIALSTDGDNRPADVLRNADIAMYRAKELGKQRFEVFTPDLLTNAVSRLDVETDLARALERGEFRLFYQPVVSLDDGLVAGFEALVRWQHPRRGLVMPDQFIGVAEENGSIVPIGEWILYEACRQLTEWHTALPGARGLRMNVNVSARQLRSTGFCDVVVGALAASSLDADAINIEITETVLVDDAENARRTLAELRALGVHIHLDDFGTGYSSLAYLRDLPIDAVKIDRSFVGYPAARPDCGLLSIEIVRTVLALADSLALKVTAEGIETRQQLEQLRALGCPSGQGYYFSRPVPPERASEMIGRPPHSLPLVPVAPVPA